MASQIDRILEHLDKHGTITQTEALQEYGIARLASRISDIKAAGISIKTELVTSQNRFGDKVRFARYSLNQEED